MAAPAQTPASIAAQHFLTGGARYKCNRPLRIMGIQQETPLAWSADGTRLAFASESNSIFLCVLRDNNFVIENTLVGHTKHINDLLWHPRDNVLLSCGKEGVFVWDGASGICLKYMSSINDMPDYHEGSVEIMGWLYDGTTLVTGCKDTNLKFWDYTDDFRLIETLTGHKSAILCVSFNPATNQLASSGRDSQIKIWDVATLDLSWRPKRKDDGSIRCAEIKSMDGHRGDVCCLEWAKDGSMLFSGARDNELKVWDVGGGQDIRTLYGHKGDIRNIMLLNEEKLLLTGSNDSTIKLWELVTVDKLPSQLLAFDLDGEDDEPLGSLAAGISLDPETALSGGGGSSALDLLAGPSPTSIGVGNTEVDKCVMTFPAHEDTIYAMELNVVLPFMATSSAGNCVRIWDIRDLVHMKLVAEFVGHAEDIMAVNMLRQDQQVVSASLDFKIFLYNVNTIQRVVSFDFLGSCTTMTVNPEETVVFVGGTHYEVKAYSLNPEANYPQVATFRGHSGRVEAIAVSPNNQLMATGGHDFDIFIWPVKPQYDLAREKPEIVTPLQRVDAHKGHITQLEFSEDGQWLASSGTDHVLGVWKVGNRKIKEHKSLAAHSSVVGSTIWGRGPTSDYVASCSWDAEVKIWRGTDGSGDPVATLTGHGGKVTDVSVSKCGKYLISCAADCTIRVCQMEAPYECVALYETPHTEGPFVCVDGGISSFVSGSGNGMLRVWPLPVEEHMSMFVLDPTFNAAPADVAVDVQPE